MTRTTHAARRLLLAASAGLAITTGPATRAHAASGPAGEADLSLRRVTLYRSGVGFFELGGAVEGDADVTLTFGEDQINDILKSLVLLDLSGGKIEAVGYDSDLPLSERLAGFGLNISDNPTLADIATRLRGEQVRLSLDTEAVTGVIVSVEQRTLTEGGQNRPQKFINLLTDRGMQCVRLRSVTNFEILNPKLAAELNLALAAMARERGADTRGVDLRFRGDGMRRVAVGYVHESPVWKTSYRLVLPDDSRGGGGGDATLQGWAIVENTTDDDWDDVTLSLVSGRPVSFVMDLANPVTLDRPEVPVPVELAAAPENYEGGIAQRKRGSVIAERLSAGRPELGRGDAAFRTADAESYALDSQAASPVLADLIASYAPAAQATGGEVGEVFQYTLDLPVTIERRRSAMLPILTAPVEARRVSIYRSTDAGPHPMRGAEITNSSGLRLLPGPISVFDSGGGASAYAGDATISHVADGSKRLLSYAVDLDVTVAADQDSTQRVDRVTIVDGALRRVTSRAWTLTYTLSNADTARGRTVIVETPKVPGWDLEKPGKPDEETASMLRFEVELDADDAETLEIVRTRTDRVSVALTSADLAELTALATDGKVSRRVLDAVEKARDLNNAIAAAQRIVQSLERERNDITAEQDRIRGNMGAIDRTSSLYKRYIEKLNDQETRFESIRRELDDARRDVERRRDELSQFLRSLGDLD